MPEPAHRSADPATTLRKRSWPLRQTQGQKRYRYKFKLYDQKHLMEPLTQSGLPVRPPRT